MSHSTSSKFTVPLETKLTFLLNQRKNFLNKIKDADEQISKLLRDQTPESNTECLRIIIAALTAGSFNFDNTILEFHQTTQPNLIIVRKDKVNILSPESLLTVKILSVTPTLTPSSLLTPRREQSIQTRLISESVKPPLQSTTSETPQGTNSEASCSESPTRNIVDFEKLAPPESFLEEYLDFHTNHINHPS